MKEGCFAIILLWEYVPWARYMLANVDHNQYNVPADTEYYFQLVKEPAFLSQLTVWAN